MFRVKDLQACEPEGLPTTPDVDGCYVVLSTAGCIHTPGECDCGRPGGKVDSMGFPSADVYAPTREALWTFIRDNWGSDDWEWIAAIVASCEEVEAPVLHSVPTVDAINEALDEAVVRIGQAHAMLREMWDRAWEDRRHSDYNELTVSLAMLDHASEILSREITG